MITRSRPGIVDVLLAMRGSIVPVIAPRLVVMLLVSAAAVAAVHETGFFAGLAGMPFTLIGIALSIFMSFRNNACYDRWWEARKLWGQLILVARSFARQTIGLDPQEREPLLIGVCGFTNGLAARLRDQDEAGRIASWIAEPVTGPNLTDAVLSGVGRRCVDLLQAGRIDSIRYSLLEGQLSQLSAIQAGCERIKGTPLPFAYSLLLHRTAYLFCLLLPFALAGSLGWWTPLLVLIVSYTFFGLDALGDELADPFGDDPNDLALDAMTRIVERDLLASLGRTELPPALLPVAHVLR